MGRVRGVDDLCPRISIAMDEDRYPAIGDFTQQCIKPLAVIALADPLRLVVWRNVQPERQFLAYVWVTISNWGWGSEIAVRYDVWISGCHEGPPKEKKVQWE